MLQLLSSPFCGTRLPPVTSSPKLLSAASNAPPVQGWDRLLAVHSNMPAIHPFRRRYRPNTALLHVALPVMRATSSTHQQEIRISQVLVCWEAKGASGRGTTTPAVLHCMRLLQVIRSIHEWDSRALSPPRPAKRAGPRGLLRHPLRHATPQMESTSKAPFRIVKSRVSISCNQLIRFTSAATCDVSLYSPCPPVSYSSLLSSIFNRDARHSLPQTILPTSSRASILAIAAQRHLRAFGREQNTHR